MSWFRTPKNEPDRETVDSGVDLVASLAEVVGRSGLDQNTLTVAVPMPRLGEITLKDRQVILLGDGQQTAEWRVTSLRELFRGDRQPPSDTEMDQYPAEHLWFFARLEEPLVTLCNALEHDPNEGG